MKLRPWRRVDETGAEKRTRRSKQQMDEFDPLSISKVYSQPKGTALWLAAVIALGVLTFVASLIGVSRSGEAATATAKIAEDNNALLKEAEDREQRANDQAAQAREHYDKAFGCVIYLWERHTRGDSGADIVGTPCAGLIVGDVVAVTSTIPTTTTTTPRRSQSRRSTTTRHPTTTTATAPPATQPPSTTTTCPTVAPGICAP